MKRKILVWGAMLVSLSVLAAVATAATPEDRELFAELKDYPCKIVHESYATIIGHWSW